MKTRKKYKTELKAVIMRRDGISSMEADTLIREAKKDLKERIHNNAYGDPFDTCQDHFGLEPDYLMDLML